MIKKTIRQILGDKLYKKIALIVKKILSFINYKVKNNPKIIISDSWKYEEYSLKNKHVFFGYYDIQQFNKCEDKLLAHIVSNTSSALCEKATVGFFDREKKEFNCIGTTSAWCWQQGARLRWHPICSDQIIFNNVNNDSYVTQVYDINTKRLIREIPIALYDVDSKFEFGVTLNFSRLQRLRPGYGYSSLPDNTANNNAPENDGIFWVDLKDNSSKLIISLKQLSELVDSNGMYEHYVNHISISPDGKRFLFFHIWNGSKNVRLYVYNIQNAELCLMEENGRVSHYDWYDNDKILVTKYEGDICKYILYETDDNIEIGRGVLIRDGHPTIYNDKNKFISDTYPLEYNQQELFEYDIKSNKKDTIAKLYSCFVKGEERRCDLHPRLSLSEKYITVDSTVDNLRKVLLFEKK